jgi:DNA-binding SARP family transcriptional activator
VPAAAETLDFKILGPLEASRSGEALDLGGAKQRALLAALLLKANEVVPVERLIDDLWGEEPPQTAGNTLQVYASRLRKVLQADVLLTQPPGYSARVEEARLDLRRFETLVSAGREAILTDELERARELLSEALSLWRGPCLAELRLHSSAATAVERLEEIRLVAREDLIVVELALGRHVDVVPELEELVAEEPFRESLRGHLMLALYRAGRQADALDAYRAARETLVEELGIDPSPQLQQLEQAILRHDPELDPPPLRPVVVAEEAVEADRRKNVAVAVIDWGLSGEVDPELVSEVARRAFTLASRSVERHHGVAYRLLDSRVLAVFGARSTHEDDVLRAGRAAIEACSELSTLGAELERDIGVRVRSRAGIDAGIALVHREESGALAITGSVVDGAHRALESANVAEVVIGGVARSLLAGVGRLEPSGTGLWRLLEIQAGASGVARRLDQPLVGRTAELSELRHLLERVVGERRCLLATVLGEAGIGKSRLALELRASADGELTVLAGACRSYGEGVTFSPVAEIVRDLIGDDDVRAGVARLLAGERDADAIADVIARTSGGEPQPATEEVFRAVRRLLETAARERPLAIVFDDIHWAEPTFLDLVEHVAETARGVPVLLLCLARPELLEDRPSWGGGKVNTTTLLLEPLSDTDCLALIEQLPAGSELHEETRARIASFAGGNPFFAEQLLAMLEHDPGFADELSSPPTVQALLGARLDRLKANDRTVLEHASVLGIEFGRGALAQLVPEQLQARVDESLDRLVRSDLVRSLDPAILVREGYAFKHALIREAAYGSLPKDRRAELHVQVAELLEATSHEKLDEVIGYHLEQAYLHRRALGRLDKGDRRLAQRAAERLGTAGRRAHAARDTHGAVSLLTRAARVLADDDPDRPELLAVLGEALRDAGRLALADSTLVEAIEAAARLGNAAAEAQALLVRWQLRLQTDPEVSFDEAAGAFAAVIERIEPLGDDRLLAKAWAAASEVPWLRGRAAETQDALERGLVYARRSGDTRTEELVLPALVGVALFGPMSTTVAIPRCEEILERASDDGSVAASALRALAGLFAMEGRFEEAWACSDRDRAILGDLGLRVVVSSAAVVAGIVGMLAGDPVRAESELRWGYEIVEEMGDRNGLSDVAAFLAEAVLLQGRDEEALALTVLSEQWAVAEDVPVQVEWRGTRAKALARRNERTEAELLAADAIALAERTDFLNAHADALMALGNVLLAGGRLDEAAGAIGEAVTLYERKRNVVSAERARALLQPFSGVRPG